MFKRGDPVSYKIKTQPPSSGINPGKEYKKAYDLYLEKEDYIHYNGIVGSLTRFYLPVTLPGGEVVSKLYDDLTFGTNNKASFKSKLPDWIGVIDGEEVTIPGKVVTVRGVINPGHLSELHIPVLVGTDQRQISYKNLVF